MWWFTASILFYMPDTFYTEIKILKDTPKEIQSKLHARVYSIWSKTSYLYIPISHTMCITLNGPLSLI